MFSVAAFHVALDNSDFCWPLEECELLEYKVHALLNTADLVSRQL